jgi:hypothetical protein
VASGVLRNGIQMPFAQNGFRDWNYCSTLPLKSKTRIFPERLRLNRGLTCEQSGLLMRIAMMESISLCEQMKSWWRLPNSNRRFEPAERPKDCRSVE